MKSFFIVVLVLVLTVLFGPVVIKAITYLLGWLIKFLNIVVKALDFFGFAGMF